jgi:pimeloyl-ACP methyl ester carboxylesterase
LPVVEINGLKMDYEDKGTGLPVIFVHGLTGSKEWFRFQLSGLSEHHRIISCNLRAASRRRDYTIESLADDLANFMTALRLHGAVIAGHDFGGLVAMQFALKYPQRTTALILISTFPYLPQQSPQTIVEWLAPGPVEFTSPIASFFRKLFGREKAGSRESEGLSWLAKHNAGLSRETLDARASLTAGFNITERLSEISVPTLLVVGSEDRAAILAGMQTLYEKIPDTTLDAIEGGDHFVFYTRHDLFNDVVDDFLMKNLASLS